ncbi:MAG: C40 family peptidase [Candidatus Eiseniibacteriota bacterium]|nr:MAG: C40 family peptidase [Candidatus Eisenbacteria bacterium]
MPKPTHHLLVATSVADIRAQASHESELVTQAVLGSQLRRLKTSRDHKWHQVKLPDGYVGWVRGWSILPVSRSQLSAWTAGLDLQVSSRSAPVRERPSEASPVVCELVLGTRLPQVKRRKGWVRTVLPDSRSGWLERKHLGRPVSGSPLSGPGLEAAIVRTALLFTGAPYLWGGITPWGCDCSGLVQTVYRLNGIDLPRDAKDQLAWLRERLIAPETKHYRRGDLLFFGRSRRDITHVAISTGGTSFIHSYGHVRRGGLKRGQSGYVHEISRSFRFAARPLRKGKKDVDKKSGLQ